MQVPYTGGTWDLFGRSVAASDYGSSGYTHVLIGSPMYDASISSQTSPNAATYGGLIWFFLCQTNQPAVGCVYLDGSYFDSHATASAGYSVAVSNGFAVVGIEGLNIIFICTLTLSTVNPVAFKQYAYGFGTAVSVSAVGSGLWLVVGGAPNFQSQAGVFEAFLCTSASCPYRDLHTVNSAQVRLG